MTGGLEIGNVVLMPRSGLVVTVKEELSRTTSSGSSSTNVWRCVDEYGNNNYVLKEIYVTTGLARIESEVNMLLQLSETAVAASGMVPSILDFSIEHGGENCCYCGLILMTLMSGTRLCNVLLQNGGSLLYSARLSMAQALLVSVSNCMRNSLDVLLVHRNFGTQNFLIHFDGTDTGKFSIVSFGSAIDKNTWEQYKWRELAVSGDCRYWPAAAWRMHLQGWTAMTQNGIEQYKSKLDIHGLALCAIEVLATGVIDHVTLEEYELVNAWREYAETVDILKAAWMTEESKSNLSSIDPMTTVSGSLGRIKRALKSLRNAHILYYVLERMVCVDEQSVTGSWEYIAEKLTSKLGTETSAESKTFVSPPVSALSSVADLTTQYAKSVGGLPMTNHTVFPSYY